MRTRSIFSFVFLLVFLGESSRVGLRAETIAPFVIAKGADWQPLSTTNPGVVAGSALDFSFLQDAPAGKYGPVMIRNGRFEFRDRPGIHARFYGVNLCHTASYLDKDKCAVLVDNLRRIGYNALRIHHFDNFLIDAKSTDSTTFDPAMLDKLDYLFFCCKKAGLYVSIDLYCSRKFKPGEFKIDGGAKAMKAMLPVDDGALDNWKRFARNLLTHRNPYTGMEWGKDPALAMIALLNEDTINAVWNKSPDVKRIYEEKFNEWLVLRKEKGDLPSSKTCSMAIFLAEIQMQAYQKMMTFVKDELKINVPLTGINYKNIEAQSFQRDALDYVDNHTYSNHPSFYPGKSYSNPVKFDNVNEIAEFNEAFRDVAHARIFGKPFTVSEFNYVYPSKYRAQGGALLGAYAGLQDWDAVFRFAYSHSNRNLFEAQSLQYFDVVQDPINLLAERMGIMLFLRGDVRASSSRRVWLYDRTAYDKFIDFSREDGRFPINFSYYGLLAQIGCGDIKRLPELRQHKNSFFYSPNLSVVSKDISFWNYSADIRRELTEESETICAETGELAISPAAKTLKVVTPNSEVVAVPSHFSLAADFLHVGKNSADAVFFVTSLTRDPLKSSSRLLLLYLTDVQNSGIKFANEDRKRMLAWGGLPLLLQHGQSEITLLRSKPCAVWALAGDGSRLREVTTTASGGGVSFVLDNFAVDSSMAFEIVDK